MTVLLSSSISVRKETIDKRDVTCTRKKMKTHFHGHREREGKREREREREDEADNKTSQ